MIDVRFEERKSNVLTPSQLPCLARVPSVNLTRGCAHGCVYCYARTYRSYPGERCVVVYDNVAEKLRDELPRKRTKPTHVYFSPSSDVFQPIDEVLELAYECFRTLLEADVGVAFVTKGAIPERHMALLCSYPHLVRAQIGLITREPSVARKVEPNAASPDRRLAQMATLSRAGIDVRVRIAPMVPSLTDEETTLEEVFRAAAEAGVRHAAINAMHLRPAITASLRRHLSDDEMGCVQRRYKDAQPLTVCGGKSHQTPLPKAVRLDLFEGAKRIARRHDIEAHVCGCMNPDLVHELCALDGEWPESGTPQHQLELNVDAVPQGDNSFGGTDGTEK